MVQGLELVGAYGPSILIIPLSQGYTFGLWNNWLLLCARAKPFNIQKKNLKSPSSLHLKAIITCCPALASQLVNILISTESGGRFWNFKWKSRAHFAVTVTVGGGDMITLQQLHTYLHRKPATRCMIRKPLIRLGVQSYLEHKNTPCRLQVTWF